MAEERLKLSESEAVLMRILWEEDCDMSMRELMDEAEIIYGKTWKMQTVSTLLRRMEEAGFVSKYREGRIFYYHAEVKLKAYRNAEILEFCKFWFNGDPAEMLEAYTKKKKLTKDQKQRIQNAIS